MASKRKGASRKAFRTPEVKNMRSALEKAKQQRDAVNALCEVTKAEREAAEQQAELLRQELKELQTDNAALVSSLELIEGQFREAQRKIISLSATRPAQETEVATAEQVAYRGFYELDGREQLRCIKIGRMLGQITSPLSAAEADELFGLMHRFLAYYRQIDELYANGPGQISKRDVILAGYQLVRLEREIAKQTEQADKALSSDTAMAEIQMKLSGKISSLPAEKKAKTWSVASNTELTDWTELPDVDARSDDEVLGTISGEARQIEQLKVEIHEVFDPLVPPDQRKVFYAEMRRLFQLCDRLNLVVSEDAPPPAEMLPFDLGNQVYWLNCIAKQRQVEKALAVEALVKFPA